MPLDLGGLHNHRTDMKVGAKNYFSHLLILVFLCILIQVAEKLFIYTCLAYKVLCMRPFDMVKAMKYCRLATFTLGQILLLQIERHCLVCSQIGFNIVIGYGLLNSNKYVSFYQRFCVNSN